MKVLYVNDTQRGPGYGFLEVRDMALVGGFEGLRFCIKRASDQQCLGKGGWQPAESFLSPEAVTLAEDGIALAVGPSVVDNLDPTETYRMTVLSADNISIVGSMRVPEVAYSLLGEGQGVGGIYVPKADGSALPPPPPPQPEPEPEPELPSEPEPETAAEELPLPPAEPKKSSAMPILIVVLLLALAGGGFAAWKFLGKDEPQVADGTKKEEPKQPEPGKDAAPKAPLAQAREHLSGDADPVKGLALAKQLQKEENGVDAAFLLAEDAAEKGNADAMLMTGAFYDPVDTSPAGSILKDPAQAFDWYTRAVEAGNAEAKNRLEALRVWAEVEAGKGSAEAQALLTRFK